MNISLPRDLEEMVERRVEAGDYASPSDLIVEALYLLAARDRFLAVEFEELRREIAVGLDQCDRGETAPFTRDTVDRIVARGKRRLAEEARRMKAEAKDLAEKAKRPVDEPAETE